MRSHGNRVLMYGVGVNTYFWHVRAMIVMCAAAAVGFAPSMWDGARSASWVAGGAERVFTDPVPRVPDMTPVLALGIAWTHVCVVTALAFLWANETAFVQRFQDAAGSLAAFTVAVRSHAMPPLHELVRHMAGMFDPMTGQLCRVHGAVALHRGVGVAAAAAAAVSTYGPVKDTSCVLRALHARGERALLALPPHASAGSVRPAIAFVIMETSRMRDAVLFAHRHPWCDRRLANRAAPILDTLLRVTPAPDPRDIIWENIDVPRFLPWRVVSNAVLASLLYVIFRGLTAIYRDAFRDPDDTWTVWTVAAAAAVVNVSLPALIKVAATWVERHGTHSGTEASLLVRMALVRAVVHVFVLYVAAPQTSVYGSVAGTTLGTRARDLILADLAISHVLRLVDPYGLFMTRVVARCLARTDEQRQWFRPHPTFPLAERYTDIFKTIFVLCAFGILAPVTWLAAAVHLALTYLTDRHLARTRWAQGAFLGPHTQRYARVLLLGGTLFHLGAAFTLVRAWPGQHGWATVALSWLQLGLGAAVLFGALHVEGTRGLVRLARFLVLGETIVFGTCTQSLPSGALPSYFPPNIPDWMIVTACDAA